MEPALACALALAFSNSAVAALDSCAALDFASSATLHEEKMGAFNGCEERGLGAGLENGEAEAKTSLRQPCVGKSIGILL